MADHTIRHRDPKLFLDDGSPQLAYERCRVPFDTVKSCMARRTTMSTCHEQTEKACSKEKKRKTILIFVVEAFY